MIGQLRQELDTYINTLEPTEMEPFTFQFRSDLVESLADGTACQLIMDLLADQDRLEQQLYDERQRLLNYLQGDPFLEQKLVENDMNILHKFDELVQRQQAVLHGLKIPGFNLTNDPTDIKLQINIFKFIRALTCFNST